MNTTMDEMLSSFIRPSDLRLDGRGLPFVGALGRCELEVAAAVLVRVCQLLHGDRWLPCTPADVKAMIAADAHTALGLMWNLPMAQPDFRGLVSKGLAKLDKDTDAITLLEPAYMAIAKAGWLRETT